MLASAGSSSLRSLPLDVSSGPTLTKSARKRCSTAGDRRRGGVSDVDAVGREFSTREADVPRHSAMRTVVRTSADAASQHASVSAPIRTRLLNTMPF